MALTERWKSAHYLMVQATSDGASGSRNYGLDDYEPIQRVQWKKLVKLGIASRHPEKKFFMRGDNWEKFIKLYGDEPTKEGCDILDVVKSLDEIF